MKSVFSNGLVVVAAVVAVGMVGSQLGGVGGLSGQAAGGDAAGCGGDAYYDEDLGELVNSEGDFVEDVSSAEPTGEFFNLEYQAHAAGERMPGQTLVTIISPNAELAQDLGDVAHELRVAVDDAGRYAVLNFIADSPELNEMRLLRRDAGEWQTVLSVIQSRGEGYRLGTPVIVRVGDDDPGIGENVVFTDGYTDLFQYRAEDGAIRVMNGEALEALEAAFLDEEPNATPVERFEERRRFLGVRSFVERGMAHQWLESFVETHFGEDVEFALNTSLNNELLVSLSTGEVLAIDRCDVGAAPTIIDGELVCRSCNDGLCNNVLNKVDALNVSLSELRGAYFETYEALKGVGLLNSQPRSGLDRHFQRLAKGRNCVGNNTGCTHVYDAAQRVYDCVGRSKCGDWNGVTAGNDYAMTKGCTVAIMGSTPTDADDWIGENGNFYLGNQNGYHKGFLNSANRLLNAGLQHCNGNTNWIGHSRGGAIAHVLAAKLGGSVHSYGAPQAFYGTTHWVNGYRFHSSNDPVPDAIYNVGGAGIWGSFKHRVANSRELVANRCVARNWWGTCATRKNTNRSVGVEHNNLWWQFGACYAGVAAAPFTGSGSMYVGCGIALTWLGARAATNHVTDYHRISWDSDLD